MKNLMLGVAMLALCSSSFANDSKTTSNNASREAAAVAAQKAAAESAPHSLAATSTCSYNFTSGTNKTFLSFCVTVNGNIAQLATPVAREHIAVATAGEGYGVCDNAAGVAYFDYAGYGDSGNWGAPTLVSQTATAVKIARTTSDGVFTLTQTITKVASPPSVNVAMLLKNNTAVARSIFLIRYADVDVSGTTSNNFDATDSSAFGWNSSGSSTPPFGLAIQNVGNPVGFANVLPLAQNVPTGPNACIPGLNEVFGQPALATDGSIAIVYEGSVPKNGTRTVTMTYRGL